MVCELILSKYPRPITRMSSHGAPYIKFVDDDMSLVFHDITDLKEYLKDNIANIEKNYYTVRLAIFDESIDNEIIVIFINSGGWSKEAIIKIFVDEEEIKKFIFELKLSGSKLFD